MIRDSPENGCGGFEDIVIYFALDGACADLGISKATQDQRQRQRVLIFMADLVLDGEHDSVAPQQRAVGHFRREISKPWESQDERRRKLSRCPGLPDAGDGALPLVALCSERPPVHGNDGNRYQRSEDEDERIDHRPHDDGYQAKHKPNALQKSVLRLASHGYLVRFTVTRIVTISYTYVTVPMQRPSRSADGRRRHATLRPGTLRLEIIRERMHARRAPSPYLVMFLHVPAGLAFNAVSAASFVA